MVAINPEPLRRLIEVAIKVVFRAMLTRAARNNRNGVVVGLCLRASETRRLGMPYERIHIPRLKANRFQGICFPGTRRSIVPSAAAVITAQGGSGKATAPNSGARVTESVPPPRVSIGERPERNVSTTRTSSS
jgi:hypothetical protein